MFLAWFWTYCALLYFRWEFLIKILQSLPSWWFHALHCKDHESEGLQDQDDLPEADSAATSDMSISSLDSAEHNLFREGFELRGMFGRHGDKHREAVQAVLPFLRQVLQNPEALANPETDNVKEAVSKSLKQGVSACWGQGGVYKSRRNFEAAIVNLYYPGVVATLHGE